MKKILTMVVLMGFLLVGTVDAQIKIGYISIENVVSIIPETKNIDGLLQQYQKDSLNVQYAQLVNQYQLKDSLYRDSLRTPAAVRTQIQGELPSIIYQIQNWQQISNTAVETKQNEYLAPIYKKAFDALKQVAKEKGYTHVFNREALLIAPDGDDMIKLVAAKLNIVLPPAQPVKPGGK